MRNIGNTGVNRDYKDTNGRTQTAQTARARRDGREWHGLRVATAD